MIYKEFVAKAAQKIMAEVVRDMTADELNSKVGMLEDYARGSVHAAKALADALEEDWKNTPVDTFHRFSDKEEFFDNYVNWAQNR